MLVVGIEPSTGNRKWVSPAESEANLTHQGIQHPLDHLPIRRRLLPGQLAAVVPTSTPKLGVAQTQSESFPLHYLWELKMSLENDNKQ